MCGSLLDACGCCACIYRTGHTKLKNKESSDDTGDRPKNRRSKRNRILLILAIIATAGVLAYLLWAYEIKPALSSSSSPSALLSFPAIMPPVRAAAPPAFRSGLSVASLIEDIELETQHPPPPEYYLQAIDASVIVDSFFNPTGGPANALDIIRNVDNRIQGITQRASQFTACFGNASRTVTFALANWTGYNSNGNTSANQSVVISAQCADVFTGPTATNDTFFDLFAVVKNGTEFHVFEYGGETMVAAIAKIDPASLPNVTANRTANSTAGNLTILSVEVWYSVGLINLNGSHGVVHILATPGNSSFEMAAAGTGIGFCGAHIISDGTGVFVVGSADMGASCGAFDSTCMFASNFTADVRNGCNGAATIGYLGRTAYTGPGNAARGASTWPPQPTVPLLIHLTADGMDDTRFGPTTIPAAILHPV